MEGGQPRGSIHVTRRLCQHIINKVGVTLMKSKSPPTKATGKKPAARRKTVQQINSEWSANWKQIIKKARTNTRKLTGKDAL